ncbi:MAG: anti-sigma factor [Acidimicrobiia bacterium]
MTQSHDSIRELLAVYALDALDADESAEVETHVSDCDGCREELDDHLAVAALMGAQSVEADVPDSLWNRVQAEIAPHPPIPLRAPRTPLVIATGAAAAMLLLVVIQTSRLATTQTELIAAQERLGAVEQAITAGDWSEAALIAASTPGARSVELTGEADAVITLLPDGTGFVTASDLDALPSGRSYQLWIVQRGEVVSAGLLRREAIGSVFRFDPATLEGLVVTEEESAGVVVSDGPAISAWFDGSA